MAGESELGLDTKCRVLAPVNHWPELVCVIFVLSDEAKTYASAEGMKRSTLTSSLLKHRVSKGGSADQHMDRVVGAFLSRDFSTLAEYVMRDSNQLHAICM